MLKTPWSYISLSDRETLLSGFIGWLMDPVGDHGFGEQFLNLMLKEAGFNKSTDSETYSVEVQAKGENRRKFDILINKNESKFIVIEVKCKTTGTKKQLDNYSEQVTHVLRVGYGEWNYPSLNDEDRRRYPLIAFDKIASYMLLCQGTKGKYPDLISSLSEHLSKEARAFEEIKEYYFNELIGSPPQRELGLSLGDRFVNTLFWNWFINHLESDPGIPRDWETKPVTSGVWCAGSHVEVDSNKELQINNLDIKLPGPLKAWIHLEIRGSQSLFGSKEEFVGCVQLRIREERSWENRIKVYKCLQKSESDLVKNGFRLSRRPSEKNYYYSAITKDLTREDFKMSNLLELLKGALKLLVNNT